MPSPFMTGKATLPVYIADPVVSLMGTQQQIRKQGCRLSRQGCDSVSSSQLTRTAGG